MAAFNEREDLSDGETHIAMKSFNERVDEARAHGKTFTTTMSQDGVMRLWVK